MMPRTRAMAPLLALAVVAACGVPTSEPTEITRVDRVERVVAPAPAPVASAVVAVDAAAEAEREAAADAAADAAVRLAAETEARVHDDEERALFEQRYPLHGISFHFLARVFAEPSDRAKVIGYMRRGARFRATQRVEGRGCARGWYEVPGPGFVCRGDGTLIGEGPQTFEPAPMPPALEDALPYAYAYTSRRSAPQYFRIPTIEEETRVASLFARLDAGEASAAATSDENPVEAPPPPGAAGESTEVVATPTDSDGGLPDYLRQRMQRGFYVSVDGETVADDGRKFVRTVRGGLVPENALVSNTPSSHRGVVLGGAWQLPLGFVYRVGAHRLTRDPLSGALTDVGLVEQHTPFVVTERFVRGPTPYLVTGDGFVLRENAARVARLRARPPQVPEGARWIHVSLASQVLVAYEGETPLFATTVSTGREGFETPVGIFRVQSKHVSTTMDDLASGPEAYSIEDVPWTMYFDGNYALHGAFWHSQFGRVRSHGCVNLAPADARWLFQWSTPTLPVSWHGVFARTTDPGTFVVIEP